MKDSIIHVALCFDQNYITPFYVLMTSVFLNNEQHSIHLHVIATGLSEQQQTEMRAFVERYGGQLFFYTITAEQTRGLAIPKGSHFTIANYYRLFIPALIPAHVGTLLYLDTDTIITGSLAELYNLELGTTPVAAAMDTEMWPRTDLGIESKDYFNSGVMLINLPQWREQQISEKAIVFAHEFPEKLHAVDQDALNAVLHGNWYQLPIRYNVMRFDVPLVSKQQMRVFLQDKVIIHYNGTKPWKYECNHLLRHIYYYYHKKSPCAKQSRYLNAKPGLKMLTEVTKNYITDAYFGYSFIYNSWHKVKRLLNK